VLNSQLWGELQLVVVQKGLQPVTLSLCSFPTRLLFPVIAICTSTLLEYSMPEFELNVQGFIEVFFVVLPVLCHPLAPTLHR
jgi:ABC-type anion transport system duplicated permease subunit